MKKVKAPYNKNEIVTVTVTDMGSSGEGIGRTQQGYTLFIKTL
jgi:23S rRNA (uracil1939-C5)-methyltransferase